MTYNKIKRKIKKLYEKERENIIIKQGNSYILYNSYKITNIDNLWEVIYNHECIHKFAMSSSALSWCLADREKQYMLADNLINSDQKLQNKRIDIIRRRRYLKNVTDPDRKAIALTRISNDVYKCKAIKIEIGLYVQMTKYIEIKGFIKP